MGLCRSPEGAAGFVLDCEERDLPAGGGPQVFVPIAKTRLRVLKVVGGLSAVKGDLKDSTMLEQLVAKLRAGEGDSVGGPATPAKNASAAAGVSAGASAVAGEGARDPMADLLGVVKGASKSKTGPARGDQEKTLEKAKGFPRGTCVSVTMPMSPKPEEAHTKQLVVYENRPGAVFVQCQDLPWFLHYMYEEIQGKRVPEPIDDDGADDALDEKRPWTTRWCPSGAWTVEVKGGPLAGRKWASKIQDLTAEKWATGAALTDVTTPFQNATRGQQKEVLLISVLGGRGPESHSAGNGAVMSQWSAGWRAPQQRRADRYNGLMRVDCFGVCAAAAAR